jgi:hypothetical protein
MAFSQLDITYLHRFIGFGAIFSQAWPLVDNAIHAVESIADGGSQPDSSAENYIKGLIYGSAAVTGTAGVTPGGASTTGSTFAQPAIRGLLQIEQAIAFQDALIGATEAEGDAKIDAYREIARLRSEGQRYCNLIAVALGMKGVIRQVFFPSSPPFDGTMDELFPYSQYWG